MSLTCVIIGKSVTKFMAVPSYFHSTFLTPISAVFARDISDPQSARRVATSCWMVLSRLRLVPLPTAARCMLRSRLPLQAMRTPTLHAPRRSRCSRASTAEAEVEAGWSTDLSWIVDMLQFGAFVALVNHFVISMTQCIGPSMKPTLTSGGDIVLLWPLPMARLLRGGPQLGDVVIATSPSDPSQSVCKRIVGMPGDVVCVPPAPWASGRGERKVDVPRGEAACRSNPRDAHPKSIRRPSPSLAEAVCRAVTCDG